MLRLGVNSLANDGAGDGASEFSSMDGCRLIVKEAGDIIEMVGLGAGESRLEIVRAPTAEGVAVHVSKNINEVHYGK
jgi:hypothetical protein